MVASPEIDAVAVVVRVPSHYAPTKAALEAGKHVYCEWPLGRTTAEAVELAALARPKGLVTAVGLQARVNPAMMHMKELVEAGYVGEVMAVHVSLMREGVLTRPSNRTWQRDAELGANTLTIANGHTVDAMRFVAGDFSAAVRGRGDPGEAVARHRRQHRARRHLARQRAGQRPVWRMARWRRSISAPYRSPAAAIAWKSTAAMGPWSYPARSRRIEQVSRTGRRAATAGADPRAGAVHRRVSQYAVGRSRQCRPDVHAVRHRIRDGKSHQPDFATAVELHHLVDAIKAGVGQRPRNDVLIRRSFDREQDEP